MTRIDERRHVAAQIGHGHADGEIAEAMATTESCVRRVRAAIGAFGTHLTPQEMIMRAWHEGLALGEYAPYPAEGKTAGTRDQVRQAKMMGFLTDSEYEAVKAASDPTSDIL